MNYFQIINECIVRETESTLKIQSSREEGHALKVLKDEFWVTAISGQDQVALSSASDDLEALPIKQASFEFEYRLSRSKNARFVFGSSSLKERLIEIPLNDTGGKAVLKIDLKDKTITGHINNTEINRNIEFNIRTIKCFGFILDNNSLLEVSFPDIQLAKGGSRRPPVETTKSTLVCVLAKDSEKNIKNHLSTIEKNFAGADWGLIIADLSSKDSTYDIIKSHDSSAKLYHYLQFESGTDPRRARKRVKELTKAFENIFPHVVMKNLIDREGKHKIQSFCTVATDDCKIEASILIKSLREFHNQPVYIICDVETKKFLKMERFKNLHFKTEASESELKKIKEKFFSKLFATVNKFHKAECILKKMDAMDFAFENHENTFFLDADVIVLENLQEEFYKDIVLSPHYHMEEELEDSFKYGFFNAGYIFCSDKTFPDYWRDIYLNRSTFFEQEGLNHALEKYDIQVFSESHNFGFWRTYYNQNLKIKSFHVHTIEREFGGEKVLQVANAETKEILFGYLNKTGNIALKEYILNSVGKSWGGIDANFNIKSSNPAGKINLKNQQVFWHHRSGWNFAIQAIAPLHNNSGVLFDGFLEKNFSWHYEANIRNQIVPYNEPWAGFFHNPEGIPKWFFYESSVQEIIKKPAFNKSLKNCAGLFALAEHHAKFLRKITGKPVSTLVHPSEIPENIFSYERYLDNPDKKIVNIGYWLRKMNSIYLLPLTKSDGITKARLIPYTAGLPKDTIDRLINTEKEKFNIKIDPEYQNNTVSLDRLSDEKYDELLTENIVFLDLYDSSANNAVIESIARATPILINPIPAVVEYLGEDYPFYFSSLEEAAFKAKDLGLIKQTHKYLLNCETRKKLSQEYFRKSLEESEVYNILK